MRIIHFQAENVKKLRAVTITPEPNGVTLSGPNESGKTSTLDAIEAALKIKDLAKDNPEIIRKGEDHAFSIVGLGEPVYDESGQEIACEPKLIVKRKWTGKDKSYLTVENAEGAVFKSPQAILDALIGDLTFDPLAFSNLKDKEQLETLLGLVKLDLDLNEWAQERQEVYDERTVYNRQAKELEARIAAIQVPDDTPDEETSAADVLREQQEAQAVIDANREKQTRARKAHEDLDYLQRTTKAKQEEIQRLEATLDIARRAFNELTNDINEQHKLCATFDAECESLVDPDMSVFAPRIAEVEQNNRTVRAKKEREGLTEKLKLARVRSETATKRITGLDKAREDALSAAKMPVEGLSFTDSGVIYKGIPFRQCSSEERLRVSVAMGMALNPKLRVMFIRDASLLDTKHREIIQQMAVDNQYQLWLEVADDTGKVGLYFEDGEIVAGQEQEKAPAPIPKRRPKKAATDQQGLGL